MVWAFSNVIQNWMRNRNTVDFLAVWEELHNPDFNRVQFEAVRSEAGLNRFVMTPTKWIEQTNAIGIVSKAGRYGGGTYAHNYKDFYYYGCKHRNMTRGHKCDYKKQVHEEMLDASVAEVISNPKFSDLIRNKINMEVDTSALDQEIENYKIQLRKLYHNKDTILSDMDSLDYEDKHYQRRKTDLENHLYKTYDKIDDAEVISNPKFSDLIRNKINMEVDTSALDQEIENYKIQLRKLYHNKDTILSDMDSLDYEDKHYQRRKTDLENHLYKTYDKIDDAEELLVSAKAKKRSLLADKITGDNIYKALVFFDKLYAQMNEAEKREFLSQLVDNVQIYEERKENGQWLKSIEFKLPIIEKEFTLSLDNDTQNETVVKLSLKKDTPKIEVTMEPEEESNYTPQEKATYSKIKEYVKEKYGVNVHTSYIAQVKRMCGLDMGENYNKSKKENPEVKQCPQEKVEYIKDALKHFNLI